MLGDVTTIDDDVPLRVVAFTDTVKLLVALRVKSAAWMFIRRTRKTKIVDKAMSSINMMQFGMKVDESKIAL